VHPARFLAPLAVALALGACASPSTGGVPLDSPTAVTSDATTPGGAASASATGAPTSEEWCASYATLTSVLSQSASDATGAQTALQALERFDLLWGIADNMGILTAPEVAANQRAVASYRAVMTVMASGHAAGSAEVSSARAALTAQTTTDHALLASSAGKVVGLCGAPTPRPSS
jgi:hypothetical protein